jgi:hypothetical protein
MSAQTCDTALCNLLQEPTPDPLNLNRYNYLPPSQPPAHQNNALSMQLQQAEADWHNVHMHQDMQAHAAAAQAAHQEPPPQSTAAATWGVHTMRWTGRKTPGWLLFDKKAGPRGCRYQKMDRHAL